MTRCALAAWQASPDQSGFASGRLYPQIVGNRANKKQIRVLGNDSHLSPQ